MARPGDILHAGEFVEGSRCRVTAARCGALSSRRAASRSQVSSRPADIRMIFIPQESEDSKTEELYPGRVCWRSEHASSERRRRGRDRCSSLTWRPRAPGWARCSQSLPSRRGVVQTDMKISPVPRGGTNRRRRKGVCALVGVCPSLGVSPGGGRS